MRIHLHRLMFHFFLTLDLIDICTFCRLSSLWYRYLTFCKSNNYRSEMSRFSFHCFIRIIKSYAFELVGDYHALYPSLIMVLPTITWSIARSVPFCLRHFIYYYGKQDQKFYYYFDVFPEIMVTCTMICDYGLRKRMEILILVKVLFSFPISLVFIWWSFWLYFL